MSAPAVTAKRKVYPLRDALYAALITFATSVIGLSIIYFQARDAQVQAVRSELLNLARTTARAGRRRSAPHHRFAVAGRQSGASARARAAGAHASRGEGRDLRVHRRPCATAGIYWVLDTSYQYRVPGNDVVAPFPFMMEYHGKRSRVHARLNEHVAIANTLPVRAEHHSYLSAFAPVFDSKGDFVATLGVDMVLDELDARMASLKRAHRASRCSWC